MAAPQTEAHVFSFSTSSSCVIGPGSCGKTSLLFQHALTCSRKGRRVLYICPKPLSRLPLYWTEPSGESTAPTPQSDILDRITFRYPPTLSALQEVFDKLHLKDAGPWHREKLGCIIVDDFHQYILSSPTKAHEVTTQVAQVCAHLLDATKCTGEGEASIQCVVALLKHSSVVPAVQKWFPTLLQVNEVGDGMFDITHQASQDRLGSYTIHETHAEFH